MNSNHSLLPAGLIGGLALLMICFQGCGESTLSKEEGAPSGASITSGSDSDDSTATDPEAATNAGGAIPTSTPPVKACTYNGQVLGEGQTVTGYLLATSDIGACRALTLTCKNGVVSNADTYKYSSCKEITPTDISCNSITNLKWSFSVFDYVLQAPTPQDTFYTCQATQRYHSVTTENFIKQKFKDARSLNCYFYPQALAGFQNGNFATSTLIAWLCIENLSAVSFTFRLPDQTRCLNILDVFGKNETLCSADIVDQTKLDSMASFLKNFYTDAACTIDPFTYLGDAAIGKKSAKSETNFICRPTN